MGAWMVGECVVDVDLDVNYYLCIFVCLFLLYISILVH